jgi:alkanesulfonate monooxygenase SsuD/methylene tetrahydromethanopterin reductase-like flavin-dependent oxidoreductase (luciferase family)
LPEVKYGLTLPVFGCTASDAIKVALEAEESGIDAVFVFDHLAPPGRRSKETALECFSLLGAVAGATQSVEVGALVAKVWLRPPAVTAQAFATLQEISGGRTIAGLGISDRMSSGEIDAYSLEFPDKSARIASLRETTKQLAHKGVSRVWIGGTSPALLEIAAVDAECVNAWNVALDRVSQIEEALWAVSSAAGRQLPPKITWGGDLSFLEAHREFLEELPDRGAEYLIVSVPKRTDSKRAIALLTSK